MFVKIYQISPEAAKEKKLQAAKALFMDIGEASAVDESLYSCVYRNYLSDVHTLEELFSYFNGKGLCGQQNMRSMSVSDVVEVRADGKEDIEEGFFFCASFGWKKINFDTSKLAPTMIRVVAVEPGKDACEALIDGSLKGMQQFVGGCIETVACCGDDGQVYRIVLNEEGKLMGLPKNRGLYDDNGNIIDILVGSFFVCKDSGEELCSLDPQEVKQIMHLINRSPKFEME